MSALESLDELERLDPDVASGSEEASELMRHHARSAADWRDLVRRYAGSRAVAVVVGLASCMARLAKEEAADEPPVADLLERVQRHDHPQVMQLSLSAAQRCMDRGWVPDMSPEAPLLTLVTRAFEYRGVGAHPLHLTAIGIAQEFADGGRLSTAARAARERVIRALADLGSAGVAAAWEARDLLALLAGSGPVDGPAGAPPAP